MLFFKKKNLFIKHIPNHIISGFRIDDDFGIGFDGGLNLVIYNKYKILGSKEAEHKDLIGCKVLKIKQTKDIFIIFLTNNISIEVGLTADDYDGPEAIQLVLPSQISIIHRWGD